MLVSWLKADWTWTAFAGATQRQSRPGSIATPTGFTPSLSTGWGRDRDLARDAVQQTFLTAMDSIESFDADRGSMGAWLFFLARNAIRRVLRDTGRGPNAPPPIPSDVAEALAMLDSALLPDELCHRREVIELVRLVVWALPTDTRNLLFSRYWLQRPLAKMAEDLDITESAVKSRLHRARHAFRSALSEMTGSSSTAEPVLEVIR
jgi:RNA polymerase sigma-70 factor (ECF subfamily)